VEASDLSGWLARFKEAVARRKSFEDPRMPKRGCCGPRGGRRILFLVVVSLLLAAALALLLFVLVKLSKAG
jgi:hypothetical protein